MVKMVVCNKYKCTFVPSLSHQNSPKSFKKSTQVLKDEARLYLLGARLGDSLLGYLTAGEQSQIHPNMKEVAKKTHGIRRDFEQPLPEDRGQRPRQTGK